MKKMTRKPIFCFAFFLFSLIVFLSFGSTSYCQGPKNPLVALEPIKCDSSSNAYVGKALTEMLVTRLSSEEIDTVVIDSPASKDSVAELADFLLSGRVAKRAGRFQAYFELKSPKKGESIKSWELFAPTLGMLAKKTSLLSAKMADTIKNTGEVLVAETVSSFAGSGTKNIGNNDEFEMARLHPDILVRERLEKDEEREIMQQNRAASNGSGRSAAAKGGEDSFMPLPDVYDSGDDVPEGEVANNKDSAAQSPSVNKEEDDSSFFPLPDVYDPDDDENAAEAPKAEAQEKPESGAGSNQSLSASTEEPKHASKSWYSRLWPFGGNENESGPPAVSKAKETRLRKEKEDKEPVIVNSNKGLPVPPPPHVDFHVPEPVPLDQALSKIENLSVEKKEKKGWFSWLWPWGNEEEEVVLHTAASSAPSNGLGQSAAASSGGLQTFDSGSEIEAMRRAVGAQTQPEAAPEESSGPSLEHHEEEPVQPQGLEAPPSPEENGRHQVQGPLWQWN